MKSRDDFETQAEFDSYVEYMMGNPADDWGLPERFTAEIEQIFKATGNGMKSHDTYDTFLEASGGYGNGKTREVHLLTRSNDGEFAQGWFDARELRDFLNTILEGGAND